MSNALIIGSDGFLDLHLVDRAASLSTNVSVLYRFRDDRSKNLEQQRGKVRFIAGD